MAGLPDVINSPYGNRPGDLPNPTPGEGAEMEVNQAVTQAASSLEPSVGAGEAEQAAMTPSGTGAPPLPGQPGSEAPGQALTAEELLRQWEQEPDASEPGQIAPGPEGIASIWEQVKEAPMRIRNAFAVTAPESAQVIRESGLFDDAKIKDGEWLVKRKGQKDWSKLDRDGIQLINDTLDFTRDALETVAEGSIEATGTVLGAIPTAGTGTVPANMAAGAVGAVGAKSLGDIVAEKVMGIKRDPERNMTAERSMAAGFGAAFGWMGSSIARRVAQRRSLKKANDYSMERVMESVNQTAEEIQTVQNSGLKLGDDGFRVDINVATGGTDPELRAGAKWLSTEEGYRQFYDEMGESLGMAYDDLAKQTARFGGKNTDNLGKNFVLTAKDVKQAEGRLIGDFVNQADKASRGRKQATPLTYQTLQAFGQEIGDAQGKITVKSAIENFGLDEGKAKMLVAKINKAKAMTKNGASVDMHKSLYDELGNVINKMNPAEYSSPHGRALIDLKNAVRDDWVDMVDNILPDSQKGAFQASRQRYKTLMDANRSLGNLLKNENISRDVLAKKLFEGQKSYDLMTSAKIMIQETNPELWQDLTTEYFRGLKRLATDEAEEIAEDGTRRAVGSVNWGKMTKRWQKLDPRVQKELAESSGFGVQGVNSLFELGRKYKNADVGFMAKEGQEAAVKRGVKALISSVLGGGAAKGTAAVNMLEGVGKDGALMKWLQDGNMEQIIKEFKGIKNQKLLRTMADEVYGWTPKDARRAPGVMLRRAYEEDRTQ